MNTAIRTDENGMTISLMGPLDGFAAEALRPTMEAALAAAPRAVTLDMRDVGFLDGAGVGVLAYLAKRLGKRVSISGAAGQPLALLRHLGLESVFRLPPAPRSRQRGAVVWGASAA